MTQIQICTRAHSLNIGISWGIGIGLLASYLLFHFPFDRWKLGSVRNGKERPMAKPFTASMKRIGQITDFMPLIWCSRMWREPRIKKWSDENPKFSFGDIVLYFRFLSEEAPDLICNRVIEKSSRPWNCGKERIFWLSLSSSASSMLQHSFSMTCNEKHLGPRSLDRLSVCQQFRCGAWVKSRSPLTSIHRDRPWIGERINADLMPESPAPSMSFIAN
jgi:hypothetical protein